MIGPYAKPRLLLRTNSCNNSASISNYSSKENYPLAIALNRLAMNLGFTIGPVLGGLLASINYHFLFWADGLTCIFAAAFIFFVLPKPNPGSRIICSLAMPACKQASMRLIKKSFAITHTQALQSGDSERTRTSNLLIRSQMLYPLSYRAVSPLISGCKDKRAQN